MGRGPTEGCWRAFWGMLSGEGKHRLPMCHMQNKLIQQLFSHMPTCSCPCAAVRVIHLPMCMDSMDANAHSHTCQSRSSTCPSAAVVFTHADVHVFTHADVHGSCPCAASMCLRSYLPRSSTRPSAAVVFAWPKRKILAAQMAPRQKDPGGIPPPTSTQ